MKFRLEPKTEKLIWAGSAGLRACSFFRLMSMLYIRPPHAAHAFLLSAAILAAVRAKDTLSAHCKMILLSRLSFQRFTIATYFPAVPLDYTKVEKFSARVLPWPARL